MGVCFSSMIFECLLFIPFPNVNHPFTSIHEIWMYLNLLDFKLYRVLRMLGYSNVWKSLQNVLLLWQLFYSTLFYGSSVIGHIVLVYENVFMFVPCIMSVLSVIWGSWWLEITNWKFVGQVWHTQSLGLLNVWFWNNLWLTEKLKR